MQTVKTPKSAPEPNKNKEEKESRQGGWFGEIQSYALQKWEDRPTLHDIVAYRFPMFLVAGAIAVGTFDAAFDTKIAESMEAEKVEQRDSFLERQVEGLVHEIGKAAVDMKDDK